MRARELIVLQALLDGRDDIINYVSEELYNNYNVDLSEYGRINLINMMTNRFGVQVAQKTFEDSEFIEFSNGKYGISPIFKQALEEIILKNKFKNLLHMVSSSLMKGIKIIFMAIHHLLYMKNIHMNKFANY